MERLVVGSIRNDILQRGRTAGRYEAEGVAPIIGPWMVMQVSSNCERALWLAYGKDGGAVAQLMEELKVTGGFDISQGALEALREQYGSGRCDEAETSATIARTFETTGEVLCPHTAVGLHVADSYMAAEPSDGPMVTLATAHPAKFPDAVEAAIGHRPALPNRMADLYERPERVAAVANDLIAIETLIRERRAA